LGNEGVVVENLGEINSLLNRTGLKLGKAMRKGLLEGAEPIRVDAGRLARANISGLRRTSTFAGPAPWSIQKKGQTIHEVYIVPKERGKRGNRTDEDRRRADVFVHLMYSRSYDPALARNEPRLRAFVDNWLGSVTTQFNSIGRVA